MIIREFKLTDQHTIARHLALNGVPFRTLSTRHISSIVAPFRWKTLGYRPYGYKPDALAYEIYEMKRDEFLRTPRGRAVLMKGGILWRLARDVVNIESVLDGPTEWAKDLTSRRSGPSVSVDDELSEQELEFICGTYRVHTDLKSDQISLSSWWPSHIVWAGSGLNLMAWSDDAEAWFQRRLEDIRENRATLKTSDAWRKSLKLQRGTARLRKHMDAAAGDFINGKRFDAQSSAIRLASTNR
ncbi:hypothetical protein HGRIS_013397 [Hohenbuehelia grisea]|uniref:Uncharacterized protein n=1 Tax=Hohenbuehelia grisea TaxID=104357 RepID=A0ABR3IVM9_9AGAR